MGAPPSIGSIPVLLGPTAVGKSAVALALAERIGADIISADSRQIYRGLDIGTAKPTTEEQARVVHHFIDERDPDEPYSAGAFADAAARRIQAGLDDGRRFIVAGGSTLYLHALLEGIGETPPSSPQCRSRLERRLEREGREQLYEELREIDPQAADSIDPANTHRLLRALEVHAVSGRPLSSFHPRPPSSLPFSPVLLLRDRQTLYRRINERVDAMVDAGLFQEVERLLEQGYDPELSPLRTIGYRECIRHLRGEIDEAEAVRLVKRNSRRYAKRQLTWFRRYPAYPSLDLDPIPTSDAAAHRILALLEKE